ncbi:hypothetical protein GCM10022222_34950 [Amycolatopsis ultiminotia]|uniref:Alpha/beta hydrolase fold-3 domain-containing protein n=1 Tax=Amycolatopsis ultiminotia TaxID=543629 RepID=A0ABP6WA26_9PSEU
MTESNTPGIGRRRFFGVSAGAAGLLAGTAACDSGDAAGAAPSAEGSDHLLNLPGIPVATDYEALRRQRMTQVDPEMKAVYDRVAAGPSIRQTGIAAMRTGAGRPEASVVPKGVTARNIEIPGPAGPVPTRIWMSEGAAEPVGVYLSTHGGGWNFSNGMAGHDAEEGQHVLDWGCAVVRPDFRVAPEHKFPAAVEDCYAALQYLGRNGHELGLDPARIGVGGGCAGGSIGTVISLMARDAGETVPAVQFLWSPATDMRNNYLSHLEFADGYGLRLDDADFVSQNYLRSREDAYDWRASPVLAPSLKGAPPALGWLGEWEILHGEAMAYVNRLRDAGVPVHLFEGPQQGHGFRYLYPDTQYSPETRPQIDKIMRDYLGPKS